MPAENLHIILSSNELPFEVIMYNRALHINIRSPDMIINMALIDDRLGMDVYPLTTQLDNYVGKIHQR